LLFFEIEIMCKGKYLDSLIHKLVFAKIPNEFIVCATWFPTTGLVVAYLTNPSFVIVPSESKSPWIAAAVVCLLQRILSGRYILLHFFPLCTLKYFEKNQ